MSGYRAMSMGINMIMGRMKSTLGVCQTRFTPKTEIASDYVVVPSFPLHLGYRNRYRYLLVVPTYLVLAEVVISYAARHTSTNYY